MFMLVSATILLAVGQNVISEEEMARVRGPLEARTKRVETLLVRYWQDWEPSALSGHLYPESKAIGQSDIELVIKGDDLRYKEVVFSPEGGANARLIVDSLRVEVGSKRTRIDYPANSALIEENVPPSVISGNLSPLDAIGWRLVLSKRPLTGLLQASSVTKLERDARVGERRAVRIRVGPPLPEKFLQPNFGAEPRVDLWLDPARDFRPLKTEVRYLSGFEKVDDNHPEEVFFITTCGDFRPVKDEKDGTSLELPYKATYEDMFGVRTWTIYEYRVNPELPPETFEPKIPNGMRVRIRDRSN